MMMNINILKMHLTAIAESISSYTSESNIMNVIKKINNDEIYYDYDLFTYCCIKIEVWYKENLDAIYSNDYVFNKKEHDECFSNIQKINKDINNHSNDYQQIINKTNKKVQQYEIPEGDFNKVFIVHGRDNEAKTEVARFLERFGLEAIILHEQSSGGKTIIEKIEKYTDVGFAVILYTPCDLGKLNEQGSTLANRARQNVIFEHGYLIGKIGRKRVNALVKGEIELPNDVSGILFTKMDGPGAWKMELAKELKKSGYAIDMNKL